MTEYEMVKDIVRLQDSVRELQDLTAEVLKLVGHNIKLGKLEDLPKKGKD